MSIRHDGPWHYEFIKGRPVGHQWRIADRDDDVVTDRATEEEARAVVRAHNASVVSAPQDWKQ